MTPMKVKCLLLLCLAGVASCQGPEPEPEPGAQIIIEDITGSVLSGDAARILNATTSPRCPVACTAYHAGASASSPFVAQVLPSGIGDLGSNLKVNCYPVYGVGAPYTDDWNVCYQGVETTPIPGPRTAIQICDELIDEIGSVDVSSLGTSGALGTRSTDETTNGRWMKGQAGIGCGWGAGLVDGNGLGGPNVNTHSWALDEWVANVGYRVKRWQTSASNEKDCCIYAMSFEGSSWQEGGSAVRFQFSSGTCSVDRETMMRANLDRSSGLSMRDTETCGTGALYWRHATGGADAANLKGGTLCQNNNGFTVLSSTSSSAYYPVGSLPDHFTGQWGNELPNHICPNWPYGDCKGVVGYNIIASPEECCEACVNLKWIEDMQGDVSMKAGVGGQVYSNPCVAWQVVGGKCRIMREQMVKEYPNFQGKTVRQAIESGTSCSHQTDGSSIWNSESHCNYYSFARYRETFNVTPPVATKKPGLNVSNATFSKVVLFDFFDEAADAALEALSLNGTTQMLEVKASILSLLGSGHSSRAATILNNNLSAWMEAQALLGDQNTCARLKLFSSTDMVTFGDGSTSLQDPSMAPWCETTACLSSGAELNLECNTTTFLLKVVEDRRRLGTLEGADARRLATNPKIAFTFDSDGTGKDNIVFNAVSVSRKTIQGTSLTISTSTTTGSGANPGTSTNSAGTLTTSSAAQARQVTGSLTVAVSDPTAFASSASVKTALQQAIADNLANIEAAWVEITSVTVARRLSIFERERRLAGNVLAQYKITIPASATNVVTPTSAGMQAIQDNIKSSLTTRLQQNGVTGITIISVVANVVEDSTSTTLTSWAYRAIGCGLPVASLSLISSVLGV